MTALTTAQADEDALRGLYSQVIEGWNRGSGEAFAAPFATDCDFIAFDGARFRSRRELAHFHDPLFKTHLKGTRLVGEVTDVHLLGNDIALLHAVGGTVLRGKTTPARERASIQTMVAERRDGVWQIRAFQNTRVRPIGHDVFGTLLWLVTDRLWRWCLPKAVSAEAFATVGGRPASPGRTQ
jgi:uncharacterized protein (TIGR02246 family)